MMHDNRESWLNGVATGMAPLFEVLGSPQGLFAKRRLEEQIMNLWARRT